MLRARGPGGTEWDADAFPAASLADAAAGSLAARGLTFAIAHAAPRRWLPLKGPTGGSAQRGAAANAARLAQLAWAAGPAAMLLCGNVVVHLYSLCGAGFTIGDALAGQKFALLLLCLECMTGKLAGPVTAFQMTYETAETSPSAHATGCCLAAPLLTLLIV